MSEWKLEILRLLRTKRWIILLAPFIVFGFMGPLVVYYLPDLLESTSSGITVIAAEAQPADGFASYIGNAMQIGLIVAIIVGVSALSIDSNPGLSVFYRTRVGPKPVTLILSRYLVTTLAAITAFLIGVLAAWYETAVLIGPADWTAIAMGSLLISIYFAFIFAVVAMSTTFSSGFKGSVGISLAVILALPVLSIISSISDWLPSKLIGGMDSLIRGTTNIEDYKQAILVALILIPALLWQTIERFNNKEI